MGGEGNFKKGECENFERKSIIRNYEKLLICQKYEKYHCFFIIYIQYQPTYRS